MKTLLFIIIFFAASQLLFCQKFYFLIMDANSSREFNRSDGVIITMTSSLYDIVLFEPTILESAGSQPPQPDCATVQMKYFTLFPSDKYPNKEDRMEYNALGPSCEYDNYYYGWDFKKKVVIKITASGYEDYIITKTYSRLELKEMFDNFSNWDRIVVYLIPKKEVLKLDGNLDVKQQVVQTESLGVLSTDEIAKKLGIGEEEIINLIKTNQLKGKKIGEKYFVRKEDFDTFMKK
jgi:excisionase family DNA binding protein